MLLHILLRAPLAIIYDLRREKGTSNKQYWFVTLDEFVRVDQDVKNIETLRYIFADIVNQPDVQEAYQEVLEAKGAKKLAASKMRS